jgi:hypothetical protein
VYQGTTSAMPCRACPGGPFCAGARVARPLLAAGPGTPARPVLKAQLPIPSEHRPGRPPGTFGALSSFSFGDVSAAPQMSARERPGVKPVLPKAPCAPLVSAHAFSRVPARRKADAPVREPSPGRFSRPSGRPVEFLHLLYRRARSDPAVWRARVPLGLPQATPSAESLRGVRRTPPSANRPPGRFSRPSGRPLEFLHLLYRRARSDPAVCRARAPLGLHLQPKANAVSPTSNTRLVSAHALQQESSHNIAEIAPRIRARLQPCRSGRKKGSGFSPCSGAALSSRPTPTPAIVVLGLDPLNP